MVLDVFIGLTRSRLVAIFVSDDMVRVRNPTVLRKK